MENNNKWVEVYGLGGTPKEEEIIPNERAIVHTFHSHHIPYTMSDSTQYYFFADTADRTVDIRMQPSSGKYEMDQEFLDSMEQVTICAGQDLEHLIEFLHKAQEMFRQEGIG